MNSTLKNLFFRYFRLIALRASCGLLAGIAAAIFLVILDVATRTRDSYPVIIWALPIAGHQQRIFEETVYRDTSEGLLKSEK